MKRATTKKQVCPTNLKIPNSLLNLVEIWGSNRLTSQNGTWTVQLPSDIKAGNYILRTELLALHLSGVAGIPLLAGGAQFYPTCFNIKIIGHGKAEPAGVLIPGAYAASDPGIGDSIYKDTIKYVRMIPAFTKAKLALIFT